MAAQLLTTKRVDNPWGRNELWPGFPDLNSRANPVGEVWFQTPNPDAADLLIKYLFTSDKLSVRVHPQCRAGARGRTVAREGRMLSDPGRAARSRWEPSPRPTSPRCAPRLGTARSRRCLTGSRPSACCSVVKRWCRLSREAIGCWRIRSVAGLGQVLPDTFWHAPSGEAVAGWDGNSD